MDAEQQRMLFNLAIGAVVVLLFFAMMLAG
jgi:hypothetical protein